MLVIWTMGLSRSLSPSHHRLQLSSSTVTTIHWFRILHHHHKHERNARNTHGHFMGASSTYVYRRRILSILRNANSYFYAFQPRGGWINSDESRS
ncbi:unnamed protein product [Lactuca virosa]|uniref:Secreted protein n=1 Tax=Lactuca virosa TaxID=75947 RepID=A0AAU9MP42_9ASTR|nr:unnamed protein product [Lactuca virosa]